MHFFFKTQLNLAEDGFDQCQIKTEGGKMLVLGENVPFSIRGIFIQVLSVYPSKFLHPLLSKKKKKCR